MSRLIRTLLRNLRSYQRTFDGIAAGVAPSGDGIGGGAGNGGDDAGGAVEAPAVFVAAFAFVRVAGDFMAAGANGSSSATIGSGLTTVVEAMPASPDCIELDSFTVMRTGTLCG